MTLAEYFNSQFSLAQNADFFFRVITACICGACIGIERSKRFKEAGIRTHVIVCCAAALMMIVSKYGFADLGETNAPFNGTRGADPARIAAQVVSGISFLGAGVIFKNGSTVKGLTTAAGIWATAGIGLAIGAGMYWIGLFVTLVVAILQITMHKFTIGADSFVTNSLRFTVYDTLEFHAQLQEQLHKWKAQVVESRVIRGEDSCVTYELTLKMPRSITLEELSAFVQAHEEVLDAQEAPVV